MEITQEMRQAVYEADCQNKGHVPDINFAFGFASDGGQADVMGPDDDHLPYLSCRRCGWVWLVMPEGFATYEEAVASLNNKLTDVKVKDIKPKKREQITPRPKAVPPEITDLTIKEPGQ